VRQLFKRKPIAELLVSELETPHSLRRVLGAGDLIMLAIGAVIGAGIFGAIGTAAAGQYDAAGNMVRAGACLDDSTGRKRLRVFVCDAR
jgi:APA family basic amino acid/polyamine antiporter